jgi:hypothetical protein
MEGNKKHAKVQTEIMRLRLVSAKCPCAQGNKRSDHIKGDKLIGQQRQYKLSGITLVLAIGYSGMLLMLVPMRFIE